MAGGTEKDSLQIFVLYLSGMIPYIQKQLYYLFACFKIHKNNVICDLFTHFVVSWHKEM